MRIIFHPLFKKATIAWQQLGSSSTHINALHSSSGHAQREYYHSNNVTTKGTLQNYYYTSADLMAFSPTLSPSSSVNSGMSERWDICTDAHPNWKIAMNTAYHTISQAREGFCDLQGRHLCQKKNSDIATSTVPSKCQSFLLPNP